MDDVQLSTSNIQSYQVNQVASTGLIVSVVKNQESHKSSEVPFVFFTSVLSKRVKRTNAHFAFYCYYTTINVV